jgi:hypothetical protein
MPTSAIEATGEKLIYLKSSAACAAGKKKNI